MEITGDCAVPEEVEHGMPVVTETEWKDVPLQAAKSRGKVPSPEPQSHQLDLRGQS